MKQPVLYVKNATEFRKWYKHYIRQSEDKNRDVNYIGSIDDTKRRFGFFDLYHGDKDSIENILKSILTTADDQQSVYEFLQNASDCGSDEFYMIFSEKELLIINNGDPFDENDLRSILNIDQSTKFKNIKKKKFSVIGKFGLGFKLAHRLVGRDEGLVELLGKEGEKYTGKHKGPVLFSWYKKEQLFALLNIESDKQIIPKYNDILTHEEKYNLFEKDITEHPLFIKMILTCFPTHPCEEGLYNLDYKDKVTLFDSNEVNEVIRFIKKNKSVIEKIKGEHGSLFYLNLGTGVAKKFIEAKEELKTGIRYSLNLLDSNLNVIRIISDVDNNKTDDDIKKIELEQITITISTSEEIFKKINPGHQDDDIKIVFAFPKRDENEEKFHENITTVRNSANIYQYFPLGSEQHGLAFIVHSNAFARKSDRKLLEDTEKNIIIFTEFVTRLKKEIEKKKKNIEFFKHIYEVILLSDNQQALSVNKKLINEYLYSGLNDYLKENIPTINSTFLQKEQVKIKGSALEIDATKIGLKDKIKKDKQELLTPQFWFAWNYQQHEEICRIAKGSAKTNLAVWYIKEVILNSDISALNDWVKKLNEKDYLRFIAEINLTGSKSEKERTTSDNSKITDLTERLKELKWLKCRDINGNIIYLSIKDINSDKNILSINNGTKDIKNILLKLGFSLVDFNLEDYPELFKEILYTEITHQQNLYSNPSTIIDSYQNRLKLKTVNNTLTQEERKILFKNQVKYCDENWELFSNVISAKKNETAPLKQIINPKSSIPKWLDAFKLNSASFNELNEKLDESKIYSNIIEPFWETIIVDNSIPTNDITDFYKKIIEYYENDNSEKKEFLGNDRTIIFNKQNFVDIVNAFIPNEISNISNYNNFESAIVKTTNRYVPKSSELALLKKAPFLVSTNSLDDLDFEHKILTQQEIEAIIEYEIDNKSDKYFFELFYITKPTDEGEGTVYVFNKNNNKSKQYFDSNQYLIDYLKSKSNFHLLPKLFFDFLDESKNVLSSSNYFDLKYGEKLYENLLTNNDSFIYALQDCPYPQIIKKYLIGKNPSNQYYFSGINLNSNTEYNETDFEYITLRLVSKHIETTNEIEQFRTKIKIDGKSIRDLAANDELEILGVKLKLSEILEKYKTAGIVNDVMNKFNISNIDKFFGITEPKDVDDVYKELEGGILLDNPYKLAFIILYAKEKEDLEVLEIFKIRLYNEDEIVFSDAGLLYLNNDISFIDETGKLDTQITKKTNYKHLETLLNQNSDYKEHGFIEIDGRYIICKEPFIDNSVFYCSPLKTSNQEPINTLDEKIKFFNYLYSKWKKNNRRAIEINKYDINALIGPKYLHDYKLSEKVYPDKYSYDNEKLTGKLFNYETYENPNDIRNQNDLIEFFASLGLNNENSEIVKLRKQFIAITEEEINLKNIKENRLLGNTLRWIRANKDKINYKFGEEKLNEIINGIYDNLHKETELLYPIISVQEELCIVFDNVPSSIGYNFDEEILNNYDIELKDFISKTQTNYQIVYSDIINKNHINYLDLKGIELEPVIDLAELEQNSTKFWDCNELSDEKLAYSKWHNTTGFEILFYGNEMPKNILFDNKIKVNNNFWYEDNYFIEGKKIYLYCEEKTFDEIYQLLKDAFETFELSEDDIEKYYAIRNKQNRDIPDETDLDIARKRLFEIEEHWSFPWLDAMIDYECEMQKKNSYSQTIIFSDVAKNGKILILSNPNTEQIPPYLADFADENGDSFINVTLFFGTRKQTIKAQVHVVDEFDMQVESIEFNLIQISNEIKQASIKLPPNTFLFDKLSESIAKIPNKSGDIKEFITEKIKKEYIEIIFGPPGTGKTQFVALRILLELARARQLEKNIKIGVFAPTNKAADVILEKILDIAEGRFNINNIISDVFGISERNEIIEYCKNNKDNLVDTFVRFGNTYNPNLGNFVKTRHSEFESESYVLISTIHRITFDEFIQTPLLEFDWDLVILDECSMIALPYAVLALGIYNSKFCLAGDPFQITPVGMTPTFPDLFEAIRNGDEYLGWNTENIYTLFELDNFSIDYTPIGGYNITKLMTQFRSIPVIGEMVRDYLYENLETYRQANEVNYIVSVGKENLSAINAIYYTPKEKATDEYATHEIHDIINFGNKYNPSFYNPYSAILACELALHIKKQHADKSIGIITPYKIQSSIMNRIIKSFNTDIEVGTVHGFQGDAKDIIIFVLNPNNLNAGNLAFINNQNIINVGISRARDFVIILIPETLKKLPEIENALKNADKKILLNTSLEKELFKDEKHIEKKSKILDFLNINVHSPILNDNRNIYEFYIAENIIQIVINK